MLANFQSVGTSPLNQDLLNNSATVYNISSANSVNIRVPTKSTPGALVIFNLSSLL